MLHRACDYLAQVASAGAADGSVPLAGPVIEGYPRAEHWTDWTYRPGHNPTAGLVGLLRRLGVEHPWVGEGSGYCWAQLESGELPEGAYTLAEGLIFLDHNPERERADRLAQAVAARLPKARQFRWEPLGHDYGLTPLHLAPKPDSRWRSLFTDALIKGHLDRLEADQESDGGWPLTWEPPSEASTWEWRGSGTLRALVTLSAYGRMAAGV